MNNMFNSSPNGSLNDSPKELSKSQTVNPLVSAGISSGLKVVFVQVKIDPSGQLWKGSFFQDVNLGYWKSVAQWLDESAASYRENNLMIGNTTINTVFLCNERVINTFSLVRLVGGTALYSAQKILMDIYGQYYDQIPPMVYSKRHRICILDKNIFSAGLTIMYPQKTTVYSFMNRTPETVFHITKSYIENAWKLVWSDNDHIGFTNHPDMIIDRILQQDVHQVTPFLLRGLQAAAAHDETILKNPLLTAMLREISMRYKNPEVRRLAFDIVENFNIHLVHRELETLQRDLSRMIDISYFS